MQLKSFVYDRGENTLNGISETRFTPDEGLFLWNAVSSTHEPFECDRSWNNEKKKSGVVMFPVSLRLAPKERKDLSIRYLYNLNPCKMNVVMTFPINVGQKKLPIVTYNSLKANPIDFLDQLLSNADNATCEMLPINTMTDYILDCFTTLERENLEAVILHYSF